MPEQATLLSADRFFAPDPGQRRVARELYDSVADLPIVCPHGHVDPRLLADENATLGTPADLFIIPDHYVFRMLYSQGSPWRHWASRGATGARLRRIIGRSGKPLPIISISSAAHPAGSGWHTSCTRCSASNRN